MSLPLVICTQVHSKMLPTSAPLVSAVSLAVIDVSDSDCTVYKAFFIVCVAVSNFCCEL